MTEEMPQQSKNNNKIFIIIGILVVALIIGIIIFFNRDSSKEPLALSVDIVAPKEETKRISYSPQNSTEAVFSVGNEIELIYVFNDGKNHDIKWHISDASLAKIEGNKVIGLKPGMVKIQAIHSGKEIVKSNFINLTFE